MVFLFGYSLCFGGFKGDLDHMSTQRSADVLGSPERFTQGVSNDFG
jgi:hypothetical protein